MKYDYCNVNANIEGRNVLEIFAILYKNSYSLRLVCLSLSENKVQIFLLQGNIFLLGKKVLSINLVARLTYHT